MEKMKQIDIEVWVANPEKPGYLMVERKKTIDEVYQELVEILKEQGVYDELDYFNNSMKWEKDKIDFPNYRWIACYAVEGGNEGHYIHVDVIFPDGSGGPWQSEILFTGKTFCGLEHALKVSNICTQSFYR